MTAQGMERLGALVGRWEQTASSDDEVLSVSPTTFEWMPDRHFLVQRTDEPTWLVPKWHGAAPVWVHSVIGFDDYSDAFTMLYVDSRSVRRTYRMTFDGHLWTMHSRPGQDFHQRYEGRISEDGNSIDGAWYASPDGREWTVDFALRHSRT